MSESENVSPRKSVRRINQDLHCFVISDRMNDLQQCHDIISDTMEALTKHGELANSIKQARK